MTAGRTNVHQTSQAWCTPPKYIQAINTFFNNRIDLDPCSNRFSLVNASTKFLLPDKDGLVEMWDFENIFVNPPYGTDKINRTTIKNWIGKCYEANRKFSSEVLALIPVATNTSHWKDFIFGKAAGICFLYDTRLKFYINGHLDEKGAPMSCAMVYWGGNAQKFVNVFSPYGAAMDTSPMIGKDYGSVSGPRLLE